ncbi:MAG: DUF4012 domain-containing protein [Candidatus Absconditabacterales bacterium]
MKLYTINGANFSSKADFAEKVVWGVDKEAAELINIGNLLYQTVTSGGSLLDHENEIRTMARIIKDNPSLESYIPQKYKALYELGKEFFVHEDQLIGMLGKDRVRTYLVALMNTAESRPNGGFFGSYALVQVYKGKLVLYKVFDSYYAYHQNSGVKLVLDEKYQEILGQQSINFISPNVYGFTDIDAGNIKILYEKLFPGQYLDGVIMVKSDLFEQLVPELRSKLIEWQFTNATVDLIRGANLPNKKQQYLTDIGSYLESNRAGLTDQIIKNLPYILRGGYVQVYIPNADKEFKDFLADQGLSTAQDPDTLYAWQLNKSFNKIDKFVTKKITFQSIQGQPIEETTNGIMPLQEDSIKPGEYDIYFFYTMSIPQTYIDQIYGLTKQYSIELTQRETHILGLSYNWHNQIIVRLPERLQFVSLDGDYLKNQPLSSGFNNKLKNTNPEFIVSNMKYRQVVSFEVLSFGNDILKVIRLRVKKI